MPVKRLQKGHLRCMIYGFALNANECWREMGENMEIDRLRDETVKSKFGFLPTSIWHITKSQPLLRFINDDIGTGSYAEGLRLSQFNPDVAELILKIWSKAGDKVLDPFAGRCRALMAASMGRLYTGYEISPKVFAMLQANLSTAKLAALAAKPSIINGDSRQICAKEEFDLVFSCPPYWNVEDYNALYGEQVQGQLSDLADYKQFMVAYGQILAKCYAALKAGGFCVWVVNDIRRDKQLIPFAADTIAIMQQIGFKCHDVIINKLNSLSIMGVAMCLDNKYMPKVHEYILIFKK